MIGVRDCLGVVLALAVWSAWATPASGQPVDFVLEWEAPGWSRGLTVDGDKVLVVEEHDAVVWTFDHDGMLLDTWGEHGSGDGQLMGPWGAEIGPDDMVYIADRNNNRVHKLTREGVFVAAFDVPDAVVFDVALDADGNIYVTSNENHQVFKLDPSGTEVTRWGSPGFDDGQFVSPRGVAVGPDGDIYVSSSLRIQRFGPDGTFVLGWPTTDSGEGIEVDRWGNVYYTSFDEDTVTKTTDTGEFLAAFTVPTAIDVAAVGDGRVFAIDTNGGRILRFLDRAVPIFVDGFESGSVGAWSSSIP